MTYLLTLLIKFIENKISFLVVTTLSLTKDMTLFQIETSGWQIIFSTFNQHFNIWKSYKQVKHCLILDFIGGFLTFFLIDVKAYENDRMKIVIVLKIVQ